MTDIRHHLTEPLHSPQPASGVAYFVCFDGRPARPGPAQAMLYIFVAQSESQPQSIIETSSRDVQYYGGCDLSSDQIRIICLPSVPQIFSNQNTKFRGKFLREKQDWLSFRILWASSGCPPPPSLTSPPSERTPGDTDPPSPPHPRPQQARATGQRCSGSWNWDKHK